MKNIKNIFLASTLASVALVGCNDLDTAPTGSTITSTQKQEVIAKDPAMIKASATAIYAIGNTYNLLNGSRHDDYGYGSLMMMMEHRGQDLVGFDTGYNWYGYELALDDHDYTWVFTRMFWSQMYSQIYAANQLAMVIDPATEDNELMFYLAQAHGMRAFAYFNLAQMYQFTYVGNESKPCVPLLLDTNADVVATEGCARATVEEVYTQIMTDLNAAITLLEKTTLERPDKRYINAGVAYGLRARVNLVMNKWAEAASDAQSALTLTGATPYTLAEVSVPSFDELDHNAWMWGVLVEETDRVVTSGIVNWPSHMGSFNYGYASVGAWRMVNQKLYNSIPDTDVRKGWFLDGNGVSANLSNAQQAYITDMGAPAYTQVKYAPYGGELGTSTNACDVPLMRAEEMYLVLAEAQAMSGNATQGAATLQNFVNTYRDPAYVCRATSADGVQEAVWNQRRIELWGEGFSYFDLLRLKKGIDRRGGGYEAHLVYNIQPNDPVLIYLIPQSEIQSNALISENDNNETAGIPTPVADAE